MKELFCLNAKIVPKKRAVVYSQDPGFLYGFGVFETLYVHKGEPIFLKAHIQRLRDNARILGIKTDKGLTRSIDSILKRNNFKTARMRINAWKGIRQDNVLVSLNKFQPYPKAVCEKGFKTIISTFKVNELSVISRIKSMNYLINVLARRQAEGERADEAILLNTKGFIVEGSRSNIFLLLNGRLFTPALSCGCLPGITRRVVINIARRQGIKVIEKEIYPDSLFKAEEIFITSSLLGIMPVTSVNKRRINKGKSGPVCKMLGDKYWSEALR